MRKTIKKIIASFIAGFCAVALILQVPRVNTWLVQHGLNLLIAPYHISIDKISGAFPFEIRVKKLTIYDNKGRWAKLNGIQYSWRGVDLFFKKITFDHVVVDSLKLYRLPKTTSVPMASIPDHLPPLTIKDFKIKDFSVNETFHATLKAKLTTPEPDHHYLTFKICLPREKISLFEIKSTLINERLSINFALENSSQDVAKLFPQLRNFLHKGDITSVFEFYSHRNLKNISGYFTGHLKDLESTHPFVSEVIGQNLQWTINTNFKPQEDNYRFVGKITSQGGIKIKWNTQVFPSKEKIIAESYVKIPHIEKFNLLDKAYKGDLLFTGNVKDNTLDWSLSGVTYQEKPLAASQGQIIFKTLFPSTRLHFNALVHAPGLASTFSGQWFYDSKSWHLNDVHIKDPRMDIHIDVMKSSSLSMALNANIKDLSILTPFTGISLVGENRLKCQINEGKGAFETFWSHQEGNAKMTGQIHLPVNSTLKVITIDQLIFSYHSNPIINLVAPVRLQWSDESLKFSKALFKLGSGQWEINEGYVGPEIKGSMSFKNIPLQTLSQLGVKWDFNGYINGSMQVKGTSDVPDLNAKITLDKVTLPHENKKNQKYVNAELNVEKKAQDYRVLFSYEDSALSQLKGQAKLKTKGGWPQQDDALELVLQGNYNFSILNGFLTNGDRLKGDLNISHKSTGTLAHPLLAGEFTLKDGMYENGELGLLIQNIRMRGRFKDREIIIDQLEGKDVAQGKASGNGKIQLANFLPQIQLNLLVHNLIVANSDLLLIRADGKFDMNNHKGNQLIINGRLVVNSADAFLADTAPKAKILKTRTLNDRSPLKPLEKSHVNKEVSIFVPQLNLTIDIPQKIFIRGYGLNSQWNGKLHLTGPVNDPFIEGSLSLIRGQMDVIGKTLQLSQGLIKFIPEKGDIDPLLNITATKVINDVKAMITIEGKASRPEIIFSSQPTLSQEEVVSLILFGKSLSSVTAAQSLQLATAIASVKSSNRQQSFAEQFRTAFGLDEIGLHGEDNSEDNNGELSSGYTVHVGKQLTDRAYIALKQGVTGEAETDVWLRYDLTEHAKAEFEAGIGRDANAAGLSWEKRY